MKRVLVAVVAVAFGVSLWRPAVLRAEHEHQGGGPWKHELKGDHQAHKEHKVKNHEAREELAERFEGPFFREQNAHVLRAYFAPAEAGHLPPGLRKHVERTGHLPPGLEKQLVRNGQLPPGLRRDLVECPPVLVGRLGPIPRHTRLYLYNRDALLVNEHTHAVVDILHNAVGRP